MKKILLALTLLISANASAEIPSIYLDVERLERLQNLNHGPDILTILAIEEMIEDERAKLCESC